MKKRFVKAGVLCLLFLLTAGATFVCVNKEPTVGTREMKDAALPVLYMEVSDILVNPMQGYAKEMEQQYMRDHLTPLSSDRNFTIVIDPFKSKISGISYQVSTADGSTVIEEGNVNGLKKTENFLKAKIHLNTPILMNQEYTLCFDVKLKNGKNYYYYTRLLQRSGTDFQPYLEFSKDFYQKCLDKEASSEIGSYLESDETETNSTYTKLNIHSSLERVSWGEMDVKLEKKAVPMIKEFNGVTCSLSVEYIISDQEEDRKDYYHVTDFYRLRSGQGRIMLLDFERRTQEIFNGEQVRVTGKGLNLGIVGKDIQYLANRNSDIVAFVQQGELWSYNRSANKVVQVYGFWDGIKERPLSSLEHDIKIVRVEESGDIDFVVYGRMGRDIHEGETGVSVYHYGAEMNQVSEELFLPINTTFEYLKNDMGQLSYITKGDKLYIILEDDLYQIDIKEKTSMVIKEDMKKDCYVVSKTQNHIAWMNEMMENNSHSVTVMNLETEESYEISAEEGQRIKALGFMNEDFVYGIANEEDIITDKAGNTTFAMETVRIEKFGGEIIKEHRQEGIWVSDVNLKEGLLELLQVQWENGGYVPVSSDHIMNNLQRKEETVSIRLITTERKATQVGLDFEKELYNKNILHLNSSLIEQEKIPKIELMLKKRDNHVYYVYGKGILDSIWTKASDAILRADEVMGIVLNRQQQYVWERGNKDESYQVNLQDIPQGILSGILDENTLQQTLGDDYTVLNMSGCTLDNILYQVGHGNPVVAKVNEQVNVVIIGYDRYNTILYNPETQEKGYYGMNDSTALFEKAGNVFVGYMEPMGRPSKGE